MNLLQRFFGWGKAPADLPMPPRPAANVGGSLSGRPTYTGLLGINALIPRDTTFALLAQFRQRVPVIKRTTEILSGFAGVPEFECENEGDEDFLENFAATIEYGDGVGRGLAVWCDDLIDQALTYGFTVGEAEIGAARNGVTRLWTYLSPSIAFRTDMLGGLQTVQQTGFGVEQTLNPLTIARVTHDPKGCNPNGESLMLALPAFCQALVDIHHAHSSTWRRNGIPIYHVHTELPSDLQDPDGAISSAIVTATSAAWNEAMRSQVMDGRAKDFFTASVGKTVVSVIGADGAVMDIDISNKVLMEQIISATGIPPFMYGLSWASTERMSKQQADCLLSTIDCIRREIESAIRKVVDLHLRLTGKRSALAYELKWPSVTLQDLKDMAQAEAVQAAAEATREKTGVALWRNGVFDQARYAEYVTGHERVVTVQTEPPALPQPGGAPPAEPDPQPQERAVKAWAEMKAEYPELWAKAECQC